MREAWARVDDIPRDRREQLDQVAAWIRARLSAGQPARLVFICTHNSRRSHMAQLWAALAATWFGIEGVETFSGGTTATAFDPRAVAALARAGFEIACLHDGDNPRYAVGFAPAHPKLQAWSKTHDDAANPHEGFAAIMTCDAADEACPVVAGADLRIALPFEDPKHADGTPEESAMYGERSAQIAAQMLYLLSRSES